MDFKINGENKKLNFGVRFAALLDESYLYKREGIEFGMGLMLSEEKLEMGSIETLATVIKCALHRESVTLDDVYDSLDEIAEKDELDKLFDQIDEQLKNSNAVRSARSRMQKLNKEANRKQTGKQAGKPTKK